MEAPENCLNLRGYVWLYIIAYVPSEMKCGVDEYTLCPLSCAIFDMIGDVSGYRT